MKTIKLKSLITESKLIPYELKIGKVYKSEFEIKQGIDKGSKCISHQEYMGYDGTYHVFKIVDILTPKTYHRKVGDLVNAGHGNISHDYSEIKK